MKSVLLLFVAVCTLIIGSMAWESKAASDAGKQKAIAHFDRPVMLMGMTLQGDYLFVHDDAAMARGEACSFIYKGTSEVKKNLVVSFHCVPVERTKAKRFAVRTTESSPGVNALMEYQFEGDTEAHGVPASVQMH
jgi:hypothetical protein